MSVSRRALIPVADLRRWARVSREEGVAIHGLLNADGVSITVSPLDPLADHGDDDDFDAKTAQFLRR